MNARGQNDGCEPTAGSLWTTPAQCSVPVKEPN